MHQARYRHRWRRRWGGHDHDRCDQGDTAADLLSINRESWPVVGIEAEPGAGAGQTFDPDQAHQVDPLTLEAYPALLTSNHAPGPVPASMAPALGRA